MINPKLLKEHNFQIDTEQERAVLPLTKDKRIKLIVDSDANLHVNWDGLDCELNTEEFDEDNIITALKTLFNGQETTPPF